MLKAFLTIVLLLSVASYADVDYPDLADRVAASIGANITTTADVETVAFWKVENHSGKSCDEAAFRDNLDIAVLNAGRFEVVDRTNLERMFKEMELSLTGLIDQGEIQRFGELYGIQAFIYGDLYNDTTGGRGNYCVVIKCIDTRTGQLIFGDILPLTLGSYNASAIDIAVDNIIVSIKEKTPYLNANNIDTIAVWDIEPTGELDRKILTDKLTAKMTSITSMRIVDRENLQKLLEEQAMGTSDLFDQSTVAEIGELYGVDGFLYGTADSSVKTSNDIITKKTSFILKMVDTEKGILRWGGKFEGFASFPTVKKEAERKREMGPENRIVLYAGAAFIKRNFKVRTIDTGEINEGFFYVPSFEFRAGYRWRFLESTGGCRIGGTTHTEVEPYDTSIINFLDDVVVTDLTGSVAYAPYSWSFFNPKVGFIIVGGWDNESGYSYFYSNLGTKINVGLRFGRNRKYEINLGVDWYWSRISGIFNKSIISIPLGVGYNF